MLKGGSAMSKEATTIILSRSLEEDKDTSRVVQDGFAAEICPAKCPSCQQSCDHLAGHAGLHHCAKGHEWA